MQKATRQLWNRARADLKNENGFGIVETLIAFTILVVGLLAVTGLTLASSTQARIADRWTDMATAGQLTIEAVQFRGYDSAISRTDTVSVGGHDYPVTLTVTNLSGRVREVQAVVDGTGPAAVRTFTARVYRPRSLPMPYDPSAALGGGGGTPPDTTTAPSDSTKVPADTTTVPPIECTDYDIEQGRC
jgi:hypothetical protein